MSSHYKLYRAVLAALFLALALLLPLLAGQIPQIGRSLCPMHFPVLLCGFFCGPAFAAAIGFLAPLLRFALFGMPPIFPSGVAMCLELATYGAAAGLLYRVLPKRRGFLYVSLLGAMLAGRLVWGAASTVFYAATQSSFGWKAFWAGAVANALPGIIAQILLIPPVLMLTQSKLPRLSEK